MKRVEFKKRALLCADWFVETIVRSVPPRHDANQGRVLYNYHVPSRTVTLGIGWSNARAIMVLLQAYSVTKDARYLDTARLAAEYLFRLQVMDRRRFYYGTFCEETPFSNFTYPRDAMEVVDALAQMAHVTGEREYLYRAKLFLKFFFARCLRNDKKFGLWPWGKVSFDGKNTFMEAEFHGGIPAILYRVHRIGGSKRCITVAEKLTRTLVERFYDPERGTLISREDTPHHGGSGEPVQNDDGCGVSLVCMYLATGEKLFLDVASSYADYLCTHPELAEGRFAAPAIQAVFLMDMYRLTGKRKYLGASRERAEIFTPRQVLDSEDVYARFGFIGEDEEPEWYYPGSKREEFVVTRATAYAAMAMFKMAGIVGPAYSAFGLE